MALPKILIWSLLLMATSYGAPKIQSLVSLYNLDNCADRSEVKNYMENMEIIQYGRETRVNGDLIVNVPIRNNSRQTLTFLKCNNREGNNCEHFLMIKLNQFCLSILDKDEVWTPFYRSATPSFECPLQGVYKFRNTTVSAAKVNKYTANIPLAINIFWKVQVRVFLRSTLLACIQFVLKVDRIRE